MGVVHVRAWQVAYRGEFPDDYLDGLKASDRAALWSRFIPHGGVVVFEDDGSVTGFASFGPSSDPQGVGELFAMNVDPKHWGRGHGSALLNHVVAELAELGFSEAVLGTGALSHRAQALYRHRGWDLDGGAKNDDVLGVIVNEVRFRRLSRQRSSAQHARCGAPSCWCRTAVTARWSWAAIA